MVSHARRVDTILIPSQVQLLDMRSALPAAARRAADARGAWVESVAQARVRSGDLGVRAVVCCAM